MRGASVRGSGFAAPLCSLVELEVRVTHSRPTRASLCAAAAAVLMLVSCDRASRTEPAAAAPTPFAGAPATSSGGIATSGSGAAGSQEAEPPTSTTTVERDPDAIKALEAMSSYLRTLKAFQIRSETSRDEVLDDGQSVEFAGVVDMLVERPNRLRADVTSDKHQRMFFDDGKSFSVWARRVNYYATIPVSGTLGDLADMLADKYDLELPIADLFYWGDRKSADAIVAALDLGASQVDGVTCEHYAFRQEGVDWQVWIQQGSYPLPRKLVITTTTDPARPRFTSVMTWNLAPSYNDAAFTFVPPKDAKRISMAERPAKDQD
jgi:hypothetical protein